MAGLVKYAAKQFRSRLTERKFLRAFDKLLRLQGFTHTIVDRVAKLCGLTRPLSPHPTPLWRAAGQDGLLYYHHPILLLLA
jgi:hypothetical protein